MSQRLEAHRLVWQEKKILREVYTNWYRKVLKDLKPGRTIELGSGSGNFKSFKKDIIAADIEKCPWLDMCFDAHFLPFRNQSIGNIVMIDVLHHLSDPVGFLKEAARVLVDRGRVILIEPYPSFFSRFIYGKFHPEPFKMNEDYFIKRSRQKKDPWDSNQAIAYLLFYQQREKFVDLFKNVFLIKKAVKTDCILYPASGGFENKALIADFMIPIFKFLEFLASGLRRFLAFRCYIILEKI